MSLQVREGSNDGLIASQDLSAGSAYLAAQSLTTSQGLCVKLDTANQGQFVVCTAVTDICIGQLLDQPQAGQVGTIRANNAAVKNYVQLGGTVTTIGQALGLNTKGQAVVVTQSAAGAQPTNTLLGYAAETGTAGAIIEFYPAGIGEKY